MLFRYCYHCRSSAEEQGGSSYAKDQHRCPLAAIHVGQQLGAGVISRKGLQPFPSHSQILSIMPQIENILLRKDGGGQFQLPQQ